MFLKLKVRIILVFLLLINNIRIIAQQLSQIYIVHPAVGDTIDNQEKIQYGLFPFYKESDFKYGIFYLVNDTYVLSSKINDTTINRPFTSQELQLVENLIALNAETKETVDAENKTEGIIIFNNDSLLHVTFDIPIKLNSSEINFEKTQFKIKYYNLAGKKITLKPDQAKEIRFKYKGQEIRILSCYDNLNLLPIIASGKHVFLHLKIDGNLKLFSYYYRQSVPTGGSGIIGGFVDLVVGLGSLAYVNEIFILQKDNGEMFRPNYLSFKKDMKDYLADCNELVKKIDNNIYSSDDIYIIVKDYNKCK